MASIQKRKNSWRAMVRRKGKSLTATFDTKAEANAWAITTEAKMLQGIVVEAIARENAAPREGTPMIEALERYADEVSPTKGGGRWEQIRLKAFIRNDSLFQRPIASITGPDIAQWRNRRLRKVAASSVNRELCLLSSVFTYAMKEWHMGITVNPCSLVTKPRKPRPRSQRVSLEDRESLIHQLGWDGRTEPKSPAQWVGFALYFALETAMRKGEILSLVWSNIDFEARYAYLKNTKNGDERYVPLSKAAMSLLKIVRHRDGDLPVVPITAGHLDKLFRLARIETGLRHVRFHDSRREATTMMAPKLSNVLELAAITGHKTLSMLQVYYRPKPADLAARLDV